MKDRRVAVLDIGSNSVRLLVADLSAGRVFCVHTEKITARLLAGFAGGRLSEASIDRTANAITALTGRARALGATDVVGFGTSAMRDGANRDELIRRAAESGATVEVMSGQDEAALAYAGAAPAGRMGVIDIGGGSTELLVGDGGRVKACSSSQVGAVRLFEALGDTDAGAMRRAAEDALSPGWAAVLAHAVDGWVGVGGTATALAAMSLRLGVYDPAAVEGFILTPESVRAWCEALAAMPRDERAKLPGLTPERADIIPYGAAIMDAFFALSGAPGVSVTDRDNLLGYIQMHFALPYVGRNTNA